MKTKKPTQRMCVGCREMKEKDQLIRIIRTPEGNFELDPDGRKNGRGAYLCRNEACFQKVKKNHGFQRSFKGNVPESVFELLEKELIGRDE